MSIDLLTLKAIKQQRLLAGPAIHNFCRLKGELRTVTPLHIGSGESLDNLNTVLVEAAEVGAADPSPAVSTPATYPYIPGTTLRGVLRSWTEAMLGPFNGAPLDVASVNGMGRHDDKVRDAKQDSGDVSEPQDQRATDRAAYDRGLAEKSRDGLDLVSGIFGSTSWRSKVAFLDARCKSENRSPKDFFGQITRVAIDRDLGAADDGKLFMVQYVRPGARFEVTLEARNVLGWELGLLLHALESFNDEKFFPTRLGAHTGHGFGEVRWKLTGVDADGWSTDPKAPSFFDAWLRRQQGQALAPIDDSFCDERRKEFTDMWLGLSQGGS